MTNHRIIFIVNPKAGKKKKMDVPLFIKSNFKSEHYFEIIVWENKNDFESIKKYIFENKFTIAVAVGGDGTVNKVASAIVHTSVSLGIIPMGSGNGLARTLNLPMNPKNALKVISLAKGCSIDSGIINDRNFFCTSGIGFDAHIGNLFSTSTKRGLQSYVKIICSEFYHYKPKHYQLTFNGTTISSKAFLITFANAGQYGNNFYIAPHADLKDGLLTMCILQPFSFYNLLPIISKIIRRKTMNSKFLKYSNGTQFTVKTNEAVIYHFDGEPGELVNEVEVSILPNSLQVIC
jgi:YegS/Rv2252/BmrU family lipid kinase